MSQCYILETICQLAGTRLQPAARSVFFEIPLLFQYKMQGGGEIISPNLVAARLSVSPCRWQIIAGHES